MATPQTIKVTLQRDSLHTPWGFRLQGGADFRTPFIVNKINAGSPADGNLHRGDIILEINQQPISYMLHGDALGLIQSAGGQIEFVVQRGSDGNQLAPTSPNQRSSSTVPWTYGNPSSPRSPLVNQLSPLSFFRNRPLERIPEPKPVLSQTGSPMMPGPVPSVSTKTRGYISPPSFHTERGNQQENMSYSPVRFVYPGPSYNNRARAMSATTSYQNSQDKSPSKDSSNHVSDTHIPSYQKQIQVNTTNVQKQYYSPPNIIHRQFNSPMSLYSNDNVQEVVNHHVSRVNVIPTVPNQSRYTYNVTLMPTNPTNTSTSEPIYYMGPFKTIHLSD